MPCVTYNILTFCWGVVCLHPTHKPVDHRLSIVYDCFLSIFTAVLHIWSLTLRSALWGHAVPWWQRPTYLDIWSFTLRERNRLRTFVNRMLRKIIVPKRGEVTGDVENCIMRGYVIHIPYQRLFKRLFWLWAYYKLKSQILCLKKNISYSDNDWCFGWDLIGFRPKPIAGQNNYPFSAGH